MGAIHDLYNNVTVKRAVTPVAVGTTGTGQVGKIIDIQGYEGVMFIIDYGSVTATNAVFTVTLKEGDATGSMTSVADADLVPDTTPEASAGLAAAAARTSDASKNTVKKIGYKGIKRYVQCGLKSTVTAGTLVAVDAVLFNPGVMPVS